MLRKVASHLAHSLETLGNISRELRWRSALAAMGHTPSAYSEHTPRYRGVNQVLGAVQTSQWLEACMKTCTLSESQTAQAVAKSSQQGGHSEHETVAPKSQRASADSECMYRTSVQAATKKPAKQPTASSSPAKSQKKTLETENKQSATAVSDALDKKLAHTASASAPSPPPAKAEAIWQASAAVLEESTPTERLVRVIRTPPSRSFRIFAPTSRPSLTSSSSPPQTLHA